MNKINQDSIKNKLLIMKTLAEIEQLNGAVDTKM